MSDIPLMPPLDDLPESMKALRDERHRKFAWAYMMGDANGAEAARWAGYSDIAEACKVRAHGLLLRDDVQAALRDLGQRYLFNLMPKSLVRLNALLDSANPLDRGKAVERVLNRVKGFAEQNKLDVEIKGEVTVSHTDAALQDLRAMIEVGFTKQQLIEAFGASGYERYMAMLDSQTKVIEHESVLRSPEGEAG